MFGERLRKLRKTKTKYTMKEFGRIFNLAESTISGYETGSRKPDMETIQRFADYFDVSIDYMIGRSDSKEETVKENLFYFNREGLTDEDIEHLKEHIEFLKKKSKQYNDENDK